MGDTVTHWVILGDQYTALLLSCGRSPASPAALSMSGLSLIAAASSGLHASQGEGGPLGHLKRVFFLRVRRAVGGRSARGRRGLVEPPRDAAALRLVQRGPGSRACAAGAQAEAGEAAAVELERLVSEGAEHPPNLPLSLIHI